MQKERLDILFVAFAPPGKVLSTRACNLALECNKQGVSSKVIFPDASAQSQELKNGDVFIRSSKERIAFVRDVRRVIKSSRPRFVHFLNPSPWAFCMVVGNRDYGILGDWEDWHTMPKLGPIKNPIHRIVDRWFIRNSDFVFTCSKWLSAEFATRFGRHCNYLPYAVSSDPFTPLANPFSSPTIVFMGHLNPWWDHRLLLQAGDYLKETYPGESLPIRIIGKGRDLEYCQKYVNEKSLNSISIAGFVPDEQMKNELFWAHGLVFPFSNNPLNLARCPYKAFLYAQAQRPIITSPYGEVKNLLGDNAIYVPFSAPAYGEAIRNCISTQREQKVDFSLHLHTWERRAARLIETLAL